MDKASFVNLLEIKRIKCIFSQSNIYANDVYKHIHIHLKDAYIAYYNKIIILIFVLNFNPMST